jgi:hypothetical protein
MITSKDEKAASPLIPAYLREKPPILLPPEPPGKRLDDLDQEAVLAMFRPVAKTLSLNLEDSVMIDRTVRHYNARALKEKRPAQFLFVEDIRKKIQNVRETREAAEAESES